MCFSNEFSTFSHKLVYFDFTVGEEAPLPGTQEHLTAMTKVSSDLLLGNTVSKKLYLFSDGAGSGEYSRKP